MTDDQTKLFDDPNPLKPWQRSSSDLRAESVARTKEAIARVDRNANDEWKEAADDAIRYVTRSRAEFTADEVWWRLEELGTPAPHEPRALGARLQAAKRAGLIVNSGQVVMSKRPETHGSWVALWRSNGESP